MKKQNYLFKNMQSWDQSIDLCYNSSNTVAFVFGSESAFTKSKIADILPEAHLIGCSTAGEIHDSKIYDECLSVGILQFEHTRIQSARVEIKDNNSYQAGLNLAKQLNHPELKCIFILAEGININGSKIVEGLNNGLSHSVVITGGLAGNGTQFKNTFTYYKSNILQNHLVAIGLYGEKLQVLHGSFGGWDYFGAEKVITSSKENVLFELDNKPALDLYKLYLGEKAKDLPGSALLFPLLIRSNDDSNESVVRTILAIDEKQKSLTFAGDVPTGYKARLMSAHFERVIDGAAEATKQMELQFINNSVLCIAISCVGRRLILGERIIEEVDAVFDQLPMDSKLIGFYSYGELSPTQKGKPCALHNQSMTVTVFHELSEK